MFLGNYADLSGYSIGGFKIFELAGRDRAKAPIWRAMCQQCRQENIFAHAKLKSAAESKAAEQVLFCQNAACSRYRKPTVRDETLSDIRRAEREEQRQAELAAQRERDRAAQHAANEAALREEKKRYLRFANAQIRAGVMPEDENFLTFERWLKSSEHWRQEVLSRIRT